MSKVKKERKGLTKLQKLQIRKYAREDRTPRQVADFVGTDYQKAYQFIINNNLPAKMNGFAKPRELKGIATRGMFVVGKQNWLL